MQIGDRTRPDPLEHRYAGAEGNRRMIEQLSEQSEDLCGDREVVGCVIVELKDRTTESQGFLKSTIQQLIGPWNICRKITETGGEIGDPLLMFHQKMKQSNT